MCGIVGIVGKTPVAQSLYDGLTVIQHRGQDAAGIMTIDQNMFNLRKANGLVRDVFHTRHMKRLSGNMGIGHVRYPTAGTSSSAEAQPFYVNSPFGIAFAHNGNLTNAHELQEEVFRIARRHINTTSDSELLLNILAHELQQVAGLSVSAEHIFEVVTKVHKKIRGAYAVVAAIIGQGIVAFRDPHGIRPLALGKRMSELGEEWMVASESVALDAVGFQFVRDVMPGEAVFITEEGQLHTRQCAENPVTSPCIFEFVYFARPDSFIDGISVTGDKLALGCSDGELVASLDVEGASLIDRIVGFDVVVGCTINSQCEPSYPAVQIQSLCYSLSPTFMEHSPLFVQKLCLLSLPIVIQLLVAPYSQSNPACGLPSTTASVQLQLSSSLLLS